MVQSISLIEMPQPNSTARYAKQKNNPPPVATDPVIGKGSKDVSEPRQERHQADYKTQESFPLRHVLSSSDRKHVAAIELIGIAAAHRVKVAAS